MNDFIQTSQDLAALCLRLQTYPFVTVDTEFIREKTYWPQLCLIQIASVDEAVCIDPLADGMDLSPLFDLMQNKNVIKVFHAARQDIEIFYHLSGKTPFPVFDTQLGAMVCGFGESVSYQNLVYNLVGCELDKSSRFTDWSRRPLTEKQIRYALADVTHLRDVYAKISDLLKKSGRERWVDDDTAFLTDPSTYENPSEDAWKRLKLNGTKPAFLAMCRSLAAYREEEAKRMDRPRRHVMRDEILIEIAGAAPDSVEELEKLRGLSQGFAGGRQGREILARVAAVKKADPKTYPVLPKPVEVPKSARAVAKMLKLLLMIKAAEGDVAERLIASLDELDVFAARSDVDLPFLKGWRFELFGKDAVALKDGLISFRYNPKKHRIDILKAADVAADVAE